MYIQFPQLDPISPAHQDPTNSCGNLHLPSPQTDN